MTSMNELTQVDDGFVDDSRRSIAFARTIDNPFGVFVAVNVSRRSMRNIDL